MVKRQAKTSKKQVLRKVILICDCSKEHVMENWCKKDITTRKTGCLFDAIAVIKVVEWRFCLRNGNHNHEATLLEAHPAHRKAARKEEILEQIANHA